MTAKKAATKPKWVDPDEAPEWTEEMFARADRYDGGALVRRGRPPLETPKVPVSIRLSADVLARFKATGSGWQTRVNEALADWLERKRL